MKTLFLFLNKQKLQNNIFSRYFFSLFSHFRQKSERFYYKFDVNSVALAHARSLYLQFKYSKFKVDKRGMGIEWNKVPIRNYYPIESYHPPFLQYHLKFTYMYKLMKLIRVHTTAYICMCFDHSFKIIANFIHVSNIWWFLFQNMWCSSFNERKMTGLWNCSSWKKGITQLSQHRQLISVRMALLRTYIYKWGLYYLII